MSYRIEWEATGVLLRYSDTVTTDELSLSAVEIFSDPRFDKLLYVIADFLPAEEFTINVPDVVFLTKHIKSTIGKTSEIRFACVADQPAARPLFRIHEWEMADVAWGGKLFHTVSEAVGWIAVSRA